MAGRVHLVRHGEVENPGHLVYAGLAGFALSDRGIGEARAMARYLGRRPIVGVWSSPLERALRTAEALAERLGTVVRVDDELREWGLMDRWAGVSWDELGERFPGELEALLAHPEDLPFASEGLSDVGSRVAEVIRNLDERHPHGELVVVTHSGPLRAAALVLTGHSLTTFWDEEPPHGSVTTLGPGPPWTVESTWSPQPEQPSVVPRGAELPE
ncbi:histidine phosphatase family protein [soil metagenome]